MGFVGAKGGAGVYQRIISWMPPHRVYCEPFAGTAAVFRHKRSCERAILVDCDPGALDQIGDCARAVGVELIVGDGMEYLKRCRFGCPAEEVVVYCDPPYPRELRRDPERDYYGREWTAGDHRRFLELVRGLPFRLLVSSYWSKEYAGALGDWRLDRFNATTRGGVAKECLWCNFPRPTRLHDYRYLGEAFPQRWRIHKRQRNWVDMLRGMPELERHAMLAAIAAAFPMATTAAAVAAVRRDGNGEGRSLIAHAGGVGSTQSPQKAIKVRG